MYQVGKCRPAAKCANQSQPPEHSDIVRPGPSSSSCPQPPIQKTVNCDLALSQAPDQIPVPGLTWLRRSPQQTAVSQSAAHKRPSLTKKCRLGRRTASA